MASLILDAANNLYGTTAQGTGPAAYGVVFKLTPNPDGSWTEKVLHSFTGGSDGADPQASLILDAAGNLYSTAYGGGIGMRGVVFELKPNSNGMWTETVLHSFAGGDGSSPAAPLLSDAAGNLYGTCVLGGAAGDGVVFKLTPTSYGWSYTKLHTFWGVGKFPVAGVIMDKTGNLYGTTSQGSNNFGLVYEIAPQRP